MKNKAEQEKNAERSKDVFSEKGKGYKFDKASYHNMNYNKKAMANYSTEDGKPAAELSQDTLNKEEEEK